MVSTSLIVALVGVGGTIIASGIGAYVNMRNTKQRISQENTRAIAEYHIERKFNSLIELYKINSKLSTEFVNIVIAERESYQDTKFDFDQQGLTKHNMDKMADLLEQWIEKKDKVDIFLDDSQKSLLNKCAIAHQIIVKEITVEEDDVFIDWESVENDPAINQMGIPLDAYRIHTRLVKEMLEEEVNKHINALETQKREGESNNWEKEFEQHYNHNITGVVLDEEYESTD